MFKNNNKILIAWEPCHGLLIKMVAAGFMNLMTEEIIKKIRSNFSFIEYVDKDFDIANIQNPNTAI